jgi:hypothetical protein
MDKDIVVDDWETWGEHGKFNFLIINVIVLLWLLRQFVNKYGKILRYPKYFSLI